MKFKITYFAAAALAAGSLLSSCSSDYLDYSPKTDISSDKLEDPSVAKSLMEGIYLAMNTQYTGLEWNQNVGESTINQCCGEGGGGDFTCYLYNDVMDTWQRMTAPNSYTVAYPWTYFYNLINLSNYLITNIEGTSEDTKGLSNEVLNYKAQAYTMRAHSYVRLLWYFGQRWEDSDNGEAYCIVLRTDNSEETMPLVTMNQVLDLIYSDLDEAIKLFGISNVAREGTYMANANVAHGEYARAALIKHDWATASAHAKIAREGTTVMSEYEQFAGFCADNSETIWSMQNTMEYPFYWSWGSHFACNGQYIYNWGVGSGAINIDLYNKLDPNDSRRKFYWTPDKLKDVPRANNRGKLTEDSFWNPVAVDADNFLNMNISTAYNKGTAGVGMLNCIAWWLHDYYENVFTGDKALMSDATLNTDNLYNFHRVLTSQKNELKEIPMGKDENGRNIFISITPINFGASMKFWATPMYGQMQMPWMRCSEMVLTEAEAEFMLGNEGNAKAALTELNSKRIPGYVCSTSGDDLLDEIRTTRRIELWGEGFNFSDLKRWNMPRVRRAWVANDPTSGNIPPGQLAGMDDAALQNYFSPKYSNGWRYMLPARETQYNKNIDTGLLKTIN